MKVILRVMSVVLILWQISCNSTSPDTIQIDEGIDKIPDEIYAITNCVTNGGLAGDTGLKTWCWNDVSIPSGGPGNQGFSNGQLGVAAECNPSLITNVDGKLRFYLDPINPAPQEWCNNSYNMRAEISTNPWNVNNPVGTEEWFGWSYTFGNDYVIDRNNEWLFFQVHEATVGTSPLISLHVSSENVKYETGEILVVNSSRPVGQNNLYYPTNVIPQAGQTVDVVVHVVWGDDSTGLLQVWLNSVKVHDRQARTVRASHPVGGNAKFGIYKSLWTEANGVQQSLEQGITHLETFMGSLRMITLGPGDPGYLESSYSKVEPR